MGNEPATFASSSSSGFNSQEEEIVQSCLSDDAIHNSHCCPTREFDLYLNAVILIKNTTDSISIRVNNCIIGMASPHIHELFQTDSAFAEIECNFVALSIMRWVIEKTHGYDKKIEIDVPPWLLKLDIVKCMCFLQIEITEGDLDLPSDYIYHLIELSIGTEGSNHRYITRQLRRLLPDDFLLTAPERYPMLTTEMLNELYPDTIIQTDWDRTTRDYQVVATDLDGNGLHSFTSETDQIQVVKNISISVSYPMANQWEKRVIIRNLYTGIVIELFDSTLWQLTPTENIVTYYQGLIRVYCTKSLRWTYEISILKKTTSESEVVFGDFVVDKALVFAIRNAGKDVWYKWDMVDKRVINLGKQKWWKKLW